MKCRFVRAFLSELRVYMWNYVFTYVPFHLIRGAVVRLFMGGRVGEGGSLLLGVKLACKGGVVIGNGSVIGQRCVLDNRGGIVIGEHVSIGPEVMLITADHDMSSLCFAGRAAGITIGDRTFIGARALILKGCEVGDGAVVAAGAVVTKSIPSGEIWAGVPARKIGVRGNWRDLKYELSYRRLFH